MIDHITFPPQQHVQAAIAEAPALMRDRLHPLPKVTIVATARLVASSTAYVALLAEREALQAERDVAVADAANWRAEAANAQAMLSDTEARIAYLERRIEKLKRELYGQRSERTARLIEQLELELEDLVTSATEDELAAAAAAAKTQSVRSFTRKRPVRKPWPENIERERVVIEPPSICACCGGSRLSKLGEDVTEKLEEIPRRFKLIETVREKFTCRDCEKITSRRRRSMPRRAASSVPNCWRQSCSTSSACMLHSTDRARASRPRGSTCRCRRWPIRSATEPSPSCRSSS